MQQPLESTLQSHSLELFPLAHWGVEHVGELFSLVATLFDRLRVSRRFHTLISIQSLSHSQLLCLSFPPPGDKKSLDRVRSPRRGGGGFSRPNKLEITDRQGMQTPPPPRPSPLHPPPTNSTPNPNPTPSSQPLHLNPPVPPPTLP